MSAAFCTLAIHAPYRKRARMLAQDVAPTPFTIVTDEPADFADLAHVRAVKHEPTGPMAVDYAKNTRLTGGTGAAAYHDKRFAVRAALDTADTAVFVDADSRILGGSHTAIVSLPTGLAVRPGVPETVETHLRRYGPERLSVFKTLADFFGVKLESSYWCDETLYAVSQYPTTSVALYKFFAVWATMAQHLQKNGVFSGEGGVMGLAAAAVGWTPNFTSALKRLAPFVIHEGGGPKT